MFGSLFPLHDATPSWNAEPILESAVEPHIAPPPRSRSLPKDTPPVEPRHPLTRQIKEFFRDIVAVMLVMLVLVVTAMASLNVVMPPVTMFQITDPAGGETVSPAVSLDHVDRDLLAAVLLHEDAQLGPRTGPFDIGQFLERVRIHRSGGNDPSGSTIPQQLVKNLVFTRDQNVLRKGLEAVLSFPFNAVLSDRRQLELYVNLAQFAPDLYGICAASWYYFNTPPWDISGDQAIVLASLLPTADYARRAEGGGLDVSRKEGVVYRAWNRNTWYLPEQLDLVVGWPGTV